MSLNTAGFTNPLIYDTMQFILITGCSADWLARSVRVGKAGGSNPLTPIFFFPLPALEPFFVLMYNSGFDCDLNGE